MTSLHTNISATAALQTLRSVSRGVDAMQQQASSGLRVHTAADNAAYWSISTTMRSDNRSLSAVTDAIGMGGALVDVAARGLEGTIAVLDAVKAKIVAAKEPGVDRSKVQAEIVQLQMQAEGIAASSSFNGVNWLSTDIDDLPYLNGVEQAVSLPASRAMPMGSVFRRSQSMLPRSPSTTPQVAVFFRRTRARLARSVGFGRFRRT